MIANFVVVDIIFLQVQKQLKATCARAAPRDPVAEFQDHLAKPVASEAKKMIPYGQMEDLLKATQLEMTRLLQVCEEQRMALGAELLNANQRLQALKPMEIVSECTEGEEGSGAFEASKSENQDDDDWDEPSPEPRRGLLIHSTTQPKAMAEMSDDKPEPLAAQVAPRRPSTRSEGGRSPEKARRPSDRTASPKESPKLVSKSPSNTSQNSNTSDVNSDYSACSAYSDGSNASCVSDADWEPDEDKRKRKKRTRRSGDKKKNETIGILLNEEQPMKASQSFKSKITKKIKKYIDHVAGALVLMNSFSMMIQLEMEGRTIASNLGLPQGHNYSAALPTFRVLDEIFVFIFLTELLLRIFVEGRHFPKDIANWLDTVLVAGGLFDVILAMVGGGSQDGVTLRFVSAMKAFRAIRMVRSFRFSPGLRMLVKACQCCLPSLCWSMLLLAVFMCMGALIMGNLLQDFIKDDNNTMEDRVDFRDEEMLRLVSHCVAWRINSGSLKSLYQKIMAKDDDETGDAAVAGDGEKKEALEDGIGASGPLTTRGNSNMDIDALSNNLVMPPPEQVLEELFQGIGDNQVTFAARHQSVPLSGLIAGSRDSLHAPRLTRDVRSDHRIRKMFSWVFCHVVSSHFLVVKVRE
eukprot:s3186_g3.t1